MARNTTAEERARWAEYMREYRRTHPTANANKPKDGAHLEPTKRQLEILAAYADPDTGGRYERVASTLGISVSAVHNQMARLMARLGVTEPSQAVMKLWVRDESTEVPEPRGHRAAPERKVR